MKKQPIFLLIAAIALLSLSGCKWKSQGDDTIEKPTTETKTPGDGNDYENEAEQYESADRVIWQKPDLVIQQLGNVDGKVVADLGAGTGYFSRRIAYKGATVIAIDIDPKAIQWMEEQKARFPLELRNRLIIRQAEANDPKLNPNEVDIVLLVNTYSYIQDRVAYFSKLKEAIRAGGNVIIIDFKKKETPFGPSIEERIDVSDVEKELKEAGYTLLAIDNESLDYQYIIKAKRN
ncbi:MAG TPA: methyltransferase domain-containing protein [Saprospiraceae bacterium]|nr:methyltransferase domain-containing protein [Saprospiraceae bacterium]